MVVLFPFGAWLPPPKSSEVRLVVASVARIGKLPPRRLIWPPLMAPATEAFTRLSSKRFCVPPVTVLENAVLRELESWKFCVPEENGPLAESDPFQVWALTAPAGSRRPARRGVASSRVRRLLHAGMRPTSARTADGAHTAPLDRS